MKLVCHLLEIVANCVLERTRRFLSSRPPNKLDFVRCLALSITSFSFKNTTFGYKEHKLIKWTILKLSSGHGTSALNEIGHSG